MDAHELKKIVDEAFAIEMSKGSNSPIQNETLKHCINRINVMINRDAEPENTKEREQDFVITDHEKRLNELEMNAINVGMLEARIDGRIDKLEATDTAFSATLKGYIERLETVEAKMDVVASDEPWEELHDRIGVVIDRLDAQQATQFAHLKKHKRQEDEQLDIEQNKGG